MIHIDEEKCTACGVCGEICPRHIMEVIDEDGGKETRIVPEREGLCMTCGHCAAVCPSEAITIDGLDPAAFSDVSPLDVEPEAMLALMAQRRSTRRYRNRPVPRDVLDRIAAAAHTAPTGTGSMSTGVIIIDGEERLVEMMKLIYADFEKLQDALGKTIPRMVVKRRAGKKQLCTLERFVMPGMKWYLKWYKEGRSDEIRRDCPAMMLFSGPADEPMVEQNCVIAAFHSILMAETLGIGTCFNDLIPPMCNRSSKLREMLTLPDDREVHTCLTMGYPKYRFRRVVPRRLAEVRYLD